MNADCICAHFAFYTQRDRLDKLDILDRYGDYMARRWAGDAVMSPLCQKITEALAWVKDHRDEIQGGPDVYRDIPVPWIRRMKRRLGMWRMPVIQMRTLADIRAGWHAGGHTRYIDRDKR